MNQTRDTAVISIEGHPFSTDPIDYDFAAHHVAFRSVYSSIVSQYRLDKIEPVLVENWSHSQDYRRWKFNVREGVRFENNDPISASDIAKSWLRMAHIMKKKQSSAGLFERIVGYDAWNGLGFPLEGLKASGHEIDLTFNAPFKDLLNTISFGLYAVVHRSCYDPNDGHWIDKRCSISSGPYRVSHWDDQMLELSRRKDFPSAQLLKPIQKIQIHWKRENRGNADLTMGLSIEKPSPVDREFYGTPAANFAYVRCHSWADPTSPCGTVEKRRALRAAFYSELVGSQAVPDLTLFPTSISGIRSFELKNTTTAVNFSQKLRFRPSKLTQIPFQAFNEAAKKIAEHFNLESEAVAISLDDMYGEMDSAPKKFSIDLSAEYSGLLIESPKEDIRFMFQSKEGIRLPDADGRIMTELAKTDFNPQVINKLVWDQAVIWPLAHFSLGFWAKKDLFDFSLINLSLPPTDFQFIQWK